MKKPKKSEADQAQGEVAKWVQEIKLYDRESEKWVERSKKIIKRYKDERGPRELKSRYNVLWSNVQTLMPAIYAKSPVPNVERRFKDDDALSRIAADVLERCATYFVKEDNFDAIMDQVVLDRLLPGRGSSWVRYVPNIKDATVDGTDEVRKDGVDVTDDAMSEVGENDPGELYSEEVVIDYIHWQDFGHTYARTWEEVRAGWKKVYMTREELNARFTEEVGKTIPLDYSPEKLNDEKISETMKKASIYEIWDKTSKTVIWIHKDHPTPLDTRDDPLKLRGFFPFPKPFYATLANDSIIPVPDYTEYQDQALELDELTARIKSITKAIKVAGVYDASAEGVQRLLAEGVENTLIQVDQYAVLAEKGGLKGVMELMPMAEIMQTLQGLYECRDKVKQDLYEITGISDIVRGATNPNETLGAQQLKGQYANLRLGKMQRGAETHARDLVRMIVEIVAEHFSMETIANISGIKLMSAQEKQMVQQQMQQAQQQGQKIPPLTDEQQEALDNPTWEDVYQLIKNDSMRCFRIDVETDSTIKTDQDAERDARIQLLTAVGGFVQQMVMAPPQVQPMLLELLQFGVRGFKVGKGLEGMFEVALKKVQKVADAPPQPDPEQQKVQQEGQIAQADIQNKQQAIKLDGQKAQDDTILKAKDLDLRNRELALKEREHEHNAKMDRAEAKKTATPEQAATDPDLNDGVSPIDKVVSGLQQTMQQQAESLNQALMQIAQMQAQGNQALIAAVTKPKQAVITDATGKVVRQGVIN